MIFLGSPNEYIRNDLSVKGTLCGMKVQPNNMMNDCRMQGDKILAFTK